MSQKENYAYKKRAHICVDCSEKAIPGRIYCQKHLDQRAARYEMIKARRATDPEYREKANASARRCKAKRRAKGLCDSCNQPATHGVYCEKHWRSNVERSSKIPYKYTIRIKKCLPTPTASYSPSMDVGKIISLYNAGWKIREIAEEIGTPLSSAYYWIQKARREALDGQRA